MFGDVIDEHQGMIASVFDAGESTPRGLVADLTPKQALRMGKSIIYRGRCWGRSGRFEDHQRFSDS